MSDELQLTPPVVDGPLVENRKIFVALPSYKTMHPKMVFSLLSIWDRRRMAASLDHGDAFIIHSRNKLADHFLKSKLEWLLTIDDDMVLPMGNAALFRSFTNSNIPDKFAGRNVVDRLLSHNKTLVGALYFGRWDHGRPMYAEGSEDRTEEKWVRSGPHDVVKPTRWVGTGCLLIHRSVFEDIEKKFPALARKADGSGGQWFTPSEHDLTLRAARAREIAADVSRSSEDRLAEVAKLLEEGHRLSGRNAGLGTGEDVILCRRALQSGHSPHVDLGCICGHVGEKVYFYS